MGTAITGLFSVVAQVLVPFAAHLAPEATRCEVRFTQIPGGEVIDVAFQRCPFDAQGRESVERALRRAPMPYDEFKSVFERQVTLTFCYPEEACR